MSSPFTAPEFDQVIAPPSPIELLWINHRGAVLGGIAALVVAVLIFLSVIAANRASRIASETLLSNSSEIQGWQQVMAQYPRTPAAANAMLLTAAALRDQGKFDESDALYSRFTETFPRNPIAVSGILGRASNARVSGHADAAVSSYQQAAAAFPQSYGAPFALLSEARILAQLGKTDEAKRVIQALASQYAGSVSIQALGGGPRGN